MVNGKKKTKLKVKMYFIQLGVWILVVFIVCVELIIIKNFFFINLNFIKNNLSKKI